MEKLTLGQTWVGVRGVSQRQQWLPVHATYVRFKCNETAKKETRGINGGKDPAGQDVGRVSVRIELSHSSQEWGLKSPGSPPKSSKRTEKLQGREGTWNNTFH